MFIYKAWWGVWSKSALFQRDEQNMHIHMIQASMRGWWGVVLFSILVF